MAVSIRGKSDATLRTIVQALANYKKEHPKAKIEAYRQNSVSIKVRVIDPDFEGVDRADRHDDVWGFLEHLSEEVLSELTIMVLITPKETKKSLANFDFENPIPSRL